MAPTQLLPHKAEGRNGVWTSQAGYMNFFCNTVTLELPCPLNDFDTEPIYTCFYLLLTTLLEKSCFQMGMVLLPWQVGLIANVKLHFLSRVNEIAELVLCIG